MKILVLGDIHGRSIWKDIFEKEDPDKVIFLGDYLHSRENISREDQIENLKLILDLKDAHSENVILCRGNHDLCCLGYYWAATGDRDPRLIKMMQPLADKFLKLSQWVHIENNIIFSHAGVSTTWMEEVAGIKYPEVINDLPLSEIFGFWPSKMSDYYGISPTQPPTWIRPQTLLDNMPKGYTQVVGHTPTNLGIRNVSKEYSDMFLEEADEIEDLYLCDALGDNQYLIIEDGQFKPMKYEKV